MKSLINKLVLVAALAISGTVVAGQAYADCEYAGSTYTCENNDDMTPDTPAERSEPAPTTDFSPEDRAA